MSEAATTVAMQEPSGFFRVIQDLAGGISSVAETVSDVRAARGENIVYAMPATAGIPGTTPGTTPADVARAAANGAGPVAMSQQTKYILAGVAVVAALALVWALARKK